jgi:hypothetical protein
MGRPQRMGGRQSTVLSGANKPGRRSPRAAKLSRAGWRSTAVTKRAIPVRQRSVATGLAAAVLATANFTACDRSGDAVSTERSKLSDDSTLADLKAEHTAAVGRQRRTEAATERKRSAPAPTGSQRIELPGGVVVVTPPAPKVTATRPQVGCRTVEGPGGRPLGIPPAPGISARRIAPGRFAVHYQFAAVDRRCRPSMLSVNVDVNDDPLPGAGIDVSVNDRRGHVVFSVPEQVADADVARAKAVGRGGVASQSTSVLIR